MNDTIETRWEQENEAGRLSFTDGDLAHAEVLDAVHHPHPTAPDHLEHAIAPVDHLADQGSSGGQLDRPEIGRLARSYDHAAPHELGELGAADGEVVGPRRNVPEVDRAARDRDR